MFRVWRRVQPVAARDAPAQPLDLGGGRDALDGVLEAGREADGARIERLVEEPFDRRAALSAVAGAAGVGHRGQPERAVRHERGDVDRRSCGVDRVEVAGEDRPVDVGGGVEPVDVVGVPVRAIDRRAAVAAVADELGRHALGDRALGRRVDDEGQVGMAVDVDEARA